MMKFEIEKRVKMQEYIFLKEAICIRTQQGVENGNFRQKKNRDEYQSQKDAETDLADSDGGEIRNFADTYEQRRSWPRYA